tara:strand:+ start:70 stop:687 length:618 start_codon:yes stop_codon:yes gene_type:complete
VGKIGLIDYGMGNIHSVQNAIETLQEEVLLIKNKNQINQCKALVIPGQGAFDPAVENLYKTDLIDNIKDWISRGNHFLGICLGLQILFENSEEGVSEGLGLIKGKIKKIPYIEDQKIPHIGWCNLIQKKESKLLKSNLDNYWVYFDHSYHASPNNENIISANVEYGSINLTAIIEKDNVVACQFHPEKSGKAGESILLNWLKTIN